MNSSVEESLDHLTNGPRKRALARRSCLTCREKKARCELPDIFVASSKDPVESAKKCHRCCALDIDCVVFDGNRKRKPNLSQQSSTEKKSKLHIAPRIGAEPAPLLESSASRSPFYESELNETRAKSLLQTQKRGWTSLWRPFFVLIDRLQRSTEYTAYLTDKIRASDTETKLLDLIDRPFVEQWSSSLDDYLVWHPYLPPLRDVYEDQARSPSRPRALLLATMCLLACRYGSMDQLQRQLRRHIDQLGIQMLLASPRDVNFIMASVLLIMHEPGLVGVSASAYDVDSRGFGLASENLLTCVLKISEELGLHQALSNNPASPRFRSKASRLLDASLWTSLKIIEGHYALLSSNKPLEHINLRLFSEAETVLCNVDDTGSPLAGPSRVSAANEGIELQQIREGFLSLEERIGKNGVLRAAGRTICSLRLKIVATFHEALCEISSIVLGPGIIADKRQKILDATLSHIGSYTELKNDLENDLRWFVNRRCVRVSEQWTRIECDFVASLLCNICTASLMNGSMDRKVEPSLFVKAFRADSEVGRLVGQAGVQRISLSRQVLASIGMLDQQPILKGKVSNSTTYLWLLPTLLTASMTIDAAKTFLEATSFTLVVFGRPPPDFDVPIGLMLRAMEGIRRIEPEGLNNISSVASNYIAEMVDVMMQWNLYYSVYRHLPVWHGHLQPNKTHTRTGSDQTTTSTSGMDDLASAAVMVTDSSTDASTGQSSAHDAFDWGLDATTSSVPSSHSYTDPGGIDDLKATFDLEAFLQDIEHLF